jgi:frataxin
MQRSLRHLEVIPSVIKFVKVRYFHSTSLRRNGLQVEATFHDICDRTLEELHDGLHAIEEKLEDAEINLSQGVLNIDLGEDFRGKIWVINKQTPNRQIWWSSPVSGPRRYEFNGSIESINKKSPLSSQWICTKNKNEDLWNKLNSEIKEITGIAMTI